MSDITAPDTIYGPGGATNHDRTGIPGNDGTPNPYPYGECTYFVWQYYHDTQGINVPPNMGNATDWVTSSHREQYSVDNTPTPGKAVSWSAAKYPPFGHIAVVNKLNGDGSFDVLEMNFTYYAADDPRLSGKIDQRTVKDNSGIQGFITPTGVRVTSDQDPSNILTALSSPFTSIGDAIRQAGLYLQAEAMTAEHRFKNMSAVGLGTVMAGGGVVLSGLTLAGRGDPGRGLTRAKRQLTRTRRKVVGPAPSPIGRRTYRTAEQQWLSRQKLKEIFGEADTSGLSPEEIADLRRINLNARK